MFSRTLAHPAAAAVLLTALFTSLPAYAIGSDTTDVPTCRKGQVYDGKSKTCVPKESKLLTDPDRTVYAYVLAKAGRYDEAIEILDTLKQPNTAEALNYRGYATRKLGRTDEGIGYYLQSVDLDPHYAKVREYLGEAYVVKGQFDLAKEQLQIIEGLCGKGCEEYEDLSSAIANPTGI